MKLVILAGGLGTRISEYSHLIPKPMIKIGARPIMWHIMKYYSQYNIKDFIICSGYKSEEIKNYFSNYFLNNSDFEVDLNNGKINILKKANENWRVKIIFTGEYTETGGRIKKIEKYIEDDNFCLTYGDGLSNVNLKKLIKNHIKSKKIITLTAVQQKSKFGSVVLKKNIVTNFTEKPPEKKNKISGGFFVISKKIFKYLNNNKNLNFEKDILTKLGRQKQINAYIHNGFWQCMDNQRDKTLLDSLWNKNKAPWKIWKT